MARRPAVADHFYPGTPERLLREVESLTGPRDESGATHAVGIVAPHAGYVYSGGIAGKVYSRIQSPRTAVIIGPNHTGAGSQAALMTEGEWDMPLGSVPIDREMADRLLRQSRIFSSDARAHQREHSLEVQVPFLQYLNPGISIVPLCLGFLGYEECRDIGTALARVIVQSDPRPLIVASSDMTHYESQQSAERKDRMAIEKILALDPRGLLETVQKENISMCGVIPTAVMLIAAQNLGAQRAELIAYATSGDVSGDYHQVVGYAGIVVA